MWNAERWFGRVFGDAEGAQLGSGWISGTASVFLEALAPLAWSRSGFPAS
jgi:hypothetical protein